MVLSFRKFRDLSILMGESDNFMLYRTELSNCLENGPCLPFLGNFLTEIAQTHTYLACIRKKLSQNGNASPRGQSGKIDNTDDNAVNKTTKRNGMSMDNGGIHRNRGTSLRDVRDSENVTPESKGHAKVKRTLSRSKLFRFASRSRDSDSDLALNECGKRSPEVLDIPDGNFRKRLDSSADSVITSSCSLNETSGPRSNPRPPRRPPLLRRLSETNHNGSSFSVKTPKRRLSETKSGESRRSFLIKGLIRKTPSSQSVKEGKVSREASSEKLTVSLSTLSVGENLNPGKSSVDRLAKSQSSPSVKEDALSNRLSSEAIRSPNFEVRHSSNNLSLGEDVTRDLQSG